MKPSGRATAEVADEQLIERVALQDHQAFEVLVKRYQTRIHDFALRVLHDRAAAYDATQETMLALFVKAHTFRPGNRMRPWLFKIALNKCRDHIRQNGKVSSDEVELADLTSPEHEVSERFTSRWLRREVDQLRSEERTAIMLRHQADMSYDQIATAMGIPVGTVKTHLFRARNRLRERLAPMLEG